MGVHAELPDAFLDIARDRENKVVIITGTGEEFSGPAATPGTTMFAKRPSVHTMDRIHWEGRHLLMNLLNIEVPVISAVNGPAWRHSEIPLLGDIVLASEDAYFQDLAHFPRGMVPGDGQHVLWPLLVGHNRARYMLLTGKRLGARDIYICATHPLLSGPAVERLMQAPVKEVAVTNTIFLPEAKRFEKLRILSIAGLLAKAIGYTHSDQSVSSLFD